jgi:pimeloyl-ACP methyl ester carboxylesterase
MPATSTDRWGTTRVAGSDVRFLRRGSGRPLVLLHTLRTQLEYFMPLLAHLDSTRYEVIVPDLPGHGRSSAPAVRYDATYFTGAVEEMLAAWDLHDAVVAGESIGGAIALALAARLPSRIARVVALNPYDYGRWGGIRRSSGLANVLFTAMLWPGIGSIVARSGTRGILRRVLMGGVYDRSRLPEDLVEQLFQCGALPGHASAFRSLCLNWRSWIDARATYPHIRQPVTLAYGDHDWSHPEEREANRRVIPASVHATLAQCGHFSSLDQPVAVARLIQGEDR